MKLLRCSLERLCPPLAVFALARLLLWRSAAQVGVDAWSASAWTRWDSFHYMSIANRGYEFFSCARLPGYDPKQWCGNTAWMPAFPMLMRALRALGIGTPLSGAMIASGFALATLILLWNAFLGPKASTAGLLTLAIAGFFPGYVYAHAVFPLSLCAFFQSASLLAHSAGRCLLAGISGAISAFAYSSGLFIAGVLGLHVLYRDRKEKWRVIVQRLLTESGLVLFGAASVLVIQHRAVGGWNSYLAVQAKYHYVPSLPSDRLAPHISGVLHGNPSGQNLQTVFVVGLVVLFIWGAARRPRKSADGVLVIFLLVYWLVPLAMGGELSLYRAEAVLLPAVPLAKKLPMSVLLIVLATAILIASRMNPLFFNGTLV